VHLGAHLAQFGISLLDQVIDQTKEGPLRAFSFKT
jgi:hypothetical protein